MGIKVIREPIEWVPVERCCFCNSITAYWSASKDVPVCETCAPKRVEDDVPDKTTWWKREEATRILETLPVTMAAH